MILHRRYSSHPLIFDLLASPLRRPLFNQCQTHRLDFVLRYYPVFKRWLTSVGYGIRRKGWLGKVLVEMPFLGRYRTTQRQRQRKIVLPQNICATKGQ